MQVMDQHTSKVIFFCGVANSCMHCTPVLCHKCRMQVISLLKVQAHICVQQRCSRLDSYLRHSSRSVSAEQFCWTRYLPVRLVMPGSTFFFVCWCHGCNSLHMQCCLQSHYAARYSFFLPLGTHSSVLCMSGDGDRDSNLLASQVRFC